MKHYDYDESLARPLAGCIDNCSMVPQWPRNVRWVWATRRLCNTSQLVCAGTDGDDYGTMSKH